MENFDSKEQEQLSKSIDEKLKKLRDFRDSMTEEEHNQYIEKIMQTLDALSESMERVREKAKYEGLTRKEKKWLGKLQQQVRNILQGVQDTQRLLGHSLYLKAVAVMNHYKQLAEQGNPQAKKMYDELNAMYKDILKSDMEDKEAKN